MFLLKKLKKLLRVCAVISAGILCAFLLLESFLQATHFIFWQLRNHQQPAQHVKSNAQNLTILCIGESTTEGYYSMRYPLKLQKILEKKYPDKNINVINRGLHKGKILYFVNSLQADLNKYHPDAVISMLGINDLQTLLTEEHLKQRITPNKWYNLRSVYFIRSLWLVLQEQKHRKSQSLCANFAQQMEFHNKKLLHNFLLFDHKPYRLDSQMQAKSQDPFSSLFWQAQTALNDHHADQTFDLLNKAAEINPAIPDIYALKACAVLKNRDKNYPNAPKIPNLQKLCQKYSTSTQNYLYTWAYWHYRHKLYKQAQAACNQALQNTPATNSVRFKIMLANIARKQGKHQKAARLFKQILKNDPKNLSALTCMAFMLHADKKYEQAIPYLSACVQYHPKAKSAMDALGIIYYNKQNYTKARPLFEAARKLYPELDSRGIRYLIEIYRKQGLNNLISQNNEEFKNNYRKIFQILDKNSVQLIAMQYPMRDVEILKAFFTASQREKIIFADNLAPFENAFKHHSYEDLFIDTFAGNFGHFTDLGSELVAQTGAKGVEEFLKRTQPGK